MHLTPHWIPLVASLGLLAGGSSASAAEEAFDLWNECAKACVLDLKDGVCSSHMSVDPAIADTNGQGVLHYSMVLEGGNTGWCRSATRSPRTSRYSSTN